MAKIKVNKDKNLDQKLMVSCGDCKRETKHSILSSVELLGEEPLGDGPPFWWSDEYQIVQCRGCETVSFREAHQNADDFEQVGPNRWEHVTTENLYPSRVEGRTPLSDYTLLPAKLQRIYLETIKALNSSQPILAGVGVRAVIETVCKEKNAVGKDLYDKINNLVTQGVLTKDGAEILHKLRILGNKAAHEVEPHEDVQLGLAMEVIDHLLLGVYILPHHAKKTFK